MKNRIPEFLLSKRSYVQAEHERGAIRDSYIAKGMKYLSEIITTGFINVGQETEKGLFRNLDPRIKVLFLIFFVIIVSLKRDIFPEVIMALFMLLMVATKLYEPPFQRVTAGLYNQALLLPVYLSRDLAFQRRIQHDF